MARKKIKLSIIKALLARSGNVCAFPGCKHPIIDENNQLIANLCHIEAYSPNGPRYNPKTTAEEKNIYDNLLFLCYRHHIETNNEKRYSVYELRKIKNSHESKYIEKAYLVDKSLVYKVKKEIEEYWQKVDLIYNHEHVFPELKFEIASRDSYIKLSEKLKLKLKYFIKMFDFIKKDNNNKYWEIFNIGIPNHFNALNFLIDQMDIKYLEETMQNNPNDFKIKNRINKLRDRFLKSAKNMIKNE